MIPQLALDKTGSLTLKDLPILAKCLDQPPPTDHPYERDTHIGMKRKCIALLAILDGAQNNGFVTKTGYTTAKSLAGEMIGVAFRLFHKAYPKQLPTEAYQKWMKEREVLVAKEEEDAKKKTGYRHPSVAWIESDREAWDAWRSREPLAKHVYNFELSPSILQHDFEPSHIRYVAKKLAETEALDTTHAAKAEGIQILKELLLISNAVQALEAKIGKPPTKAERKQKELEDAPAATKAARALVAKVLTKMTDQVKQQYIKDLEGRWKAALTKFFAMTDAQRLRHLHMDDDSVAALEAENQKAKAAYEKETGQKWGFQEKKRGYYSPEDLLPVAARNNDKEREDRHWERIKDMPFGEARDAVKMEPLKWTPFPDWKKRIHDRAVRQAESMQAAFCEKNTEKLAAIIEGKANVKGDPEILNVHCLSGVIQGNIKFSFKDASHFTVRNKIVEKGTRDVYGNWTPFWQYPTTFHEAFLASGKKMPGQPSEQEMKTIFVKGKR